MTEARVGSAQGVAAHTFTRTHRAPQIEVVLKLVHGFVAYLARSVQPHKLLSTGGHHRYDRVEVTRA